LKNHKGLYYISVEVFSLEMDSKVLRAFFLISSNIPYFLSNNVFKSLFVQFKEKEKIASSTTISP
jgi:hypothetical protein